MTAITVKASRSMSLTMLQSARIDMEDIIKSELARELADALLPHLTITRHPHAPTNSVTFSVVLGVDVPGETNE